MPVLFHASFPPRPERHPPAPNQTIRKAIGEELRAVWDASSLGSAQEELKRLVAKYHTSAPKLAAWLENSVPEGLAVFKLPRPHQRPMRTSNPIERSIQQELKRRTRKIRVFPNEASLSVSSPPFSSKSTRDGPHHRNPMSTSTTPMPINVHRGKSRRQVA